MKNEEKYHALPQCDGAVPELDIDDLDDEQVRGIWINCIVKRAALFFSFSFLTVSPSFYTAIIWFMIFCVNELFCEDDCLLKLALFLLYLLDNACSYLYVICLPDLAACGTTEQGTLGFP